MLSEQSLPHEQLLVGRHYAEFTCGIRNTFRLNENPIFGPLLRERRYHIPLSSPHFPLAQDQCA